MRFMINIKYFIRLMNEKYDVTNIILYPNHIRVRSVTLSFYLRHILCFEKLFMILIFGYQTK